MKEMSRADELAAGLASGNSDSQLKSLKAIKNVIVGSKREKTKHLQYLPSILDIVSTYQEAEVLIQAAQTIGSFASAPDGAKAVIEQGGIPKLLLALTHPDIRIVEASARALKLLYTKTTDISPKEVHQVIQTPGATTTLVALLSTPSSPSIGESAAWIIAKCCEIDEKDAKSAFCDAGALQPLVQLLQDSTQRTLQAAALSAVSALMHNDLITSREVLQHQSVVFNLLACVKSSIEDPRMRFTASVCLTNLAPALPSRLSGNGGNSFGSNTIGTSSNTIGTSSSTIGNNNSTSGNNNSTSGLVLPTREDVQDTVLPVLVRLMSEDPNQQHSHHGHHHHHHDKNNNTHIRPKNTHHSILISRPPHPTAAPPPLLPIVKTRNSVADEVPGVLIHLLENNSSLQSAAVDADAILRLAHLLKSPTTSSRGKINSLLVLGMLTETSEIHRRKLVDCGALPAVAAALTDPLLAVRGAACCCMKSLSRSTRLLQCSLGSLSDIATPLLDLSRNSDCNISTVAAATLANMAIEYSSIKEQVLVLQGIQRFGELTEANNNKKLQLYGVWGLSSAAYLSTDEVKVAVMKTLPWSRVVEFLRGDDQEVKEKTLLLLRNLAHRGGGGGGGSSAEGKSTVLEWSQGQFLPAILEALQSILEASPSPLVSSSQTRSCSTKQFENALYCVVNIASGYSADKDAVSELVTADLRPAFQAALSHSEESIREAAVWVVLNLTYVQNNSTCNRVDGGGGGGGGGDESVILEKLERRRHDLISMGIADTLCTMRNEDTSMRVRERADTAWLQLLGGRRIVMEEEEEGGAGEGRVTLSSEAMGRFEMLPGHRGPRVQMIDPASAVVAMDEELALREEAEEEDFMEEEEEDGDDQGYW